MAQTIFKVVKDNVGAQLDDTIDTIDTVIALRTGQGGQFPAAPFYCSCDYEVMICTAVIGDTLIVVRGADSTNAVEHSGGSIIELRANAGLWLDAYAAINALENGDNPAGQVANGAITNIKVSNTAGIATSKLNPWPFANTDLANYPWHNTDLSSDVARANLLVNGGFEVWQRGTSFTAAQDGFFADRWQVHVLGAGTITAEARDSANADSGGYCGAVTVGGTVGTGIAGGNTFPTNAAYVWQKLEDFGQLKGKTLSFSIRVKGPASTTVQPVFNDGTNAYLGQVFNTGASYTTITFTQTISAAATVAWVGLIFGSIGVFYLDRASVVIGSQPSDYIPLTPAEDLLRCQRYFENIHYNNSDTVVGTGMCSTTTNAIIPWIFKVRKGGTPTITISTATGFGVTSNAGVQINVTSMGSDLVGPSSCRLTPAVGSGLVAGNATVLFITGGAVCSVAAEWNP